LPEPLVDRLLAFDPGGRDIAHFFVPGGATRAARALRRAKRVILTTGFSLGPGLPETDGPPGAASLGRALRALGAQVTYITDAASLPPLQAALAVLGEPSAILTFHAAGDAALTARRLLAEHAPTHLVSVERPGRARNGEYLSMRGESVGEWNAPLDELFLQAPRRVVTVGVGDGGNEIGMGALRARLARGGPRLSRVASVVAARYAVVAGVSNWGAYGVVVELARLSKRPLLHTAEEERGMIRACVAAGAVDGITRKREATVDALPLEAHAGMVELMRLIQESTSHGGATR
jgi:D-glutamate cyclase-like protein